MKKSKHKNKGSNDLTIISERAQNSRTGGRRHPQIKTAIRVGVSSLQQHWYGVIKSRQTYEPQTTMSNSRQQAVHPKKPNVLDRGSMTRINLEKYYIVKGD